MGKSALLGSARCAGVVRRGERIAGGGTSHPPLGEGAQGICPGARLRVVNAAGRRDRPTLFPTPNLYLRDGESGQNSWGKQKVKGRINKWKTNVNVF